MVSQSVPEGTISEVLDWVDDDPGRARQALDAERAGQNRTTLVSQLETIASKEEPVSTESSTPTVDPAGDRVAEPEGQGVTSDTSTGGPASAEEADARDDAQAEQEELEPQPPTEIELSPADSGTFFTTIAVRDHDVEVPDDADLRGQPEEPEERDELEQPEVLEADPVEYMQAAAGTYGMILAFNGTAYSMTANQAAQLKQAVDKAIIGLAL